ncbi:unnamed protein product [Bursaphelenchus xylophilus]|uniref:(pine wood nematode) hypothetical protein n=1 Tax=Bursaphelenchus xylophilus TaxID=6326 RepID=A0A1I7SB00_BURXY|nr:unnamed protein product [Bursaphelenchus xylophilus]CAG9105982.1 unnamed protein product [Bursaphelenchus xylophilus]
MTTQSHRPQLSLSDGKPLVHYCGECEMPIEYCVYGQDPIRCLRWLERHLPEVHAQMVPEQVKKYKNPVTPTIIETVMIPEMRDGRFASIGSLDEFKKKVFRKERK